VTGNGPGGTRPGDRDPSQPRPEGRDPSQPRPASEGWAYLSYLIGGMAVYGLVGWLIGRWTGLPWLLGVGMLLGLASSVALIIFRVTRS
jgi:F0F1-type ATP synthase assembly protein I